MPEQERPSAKLLTDPRALRALAHPIRLDLLAVLRIEGPLTATRAGELLDESSASCSFHLRQLAKYGLVEEAGGGTGRQRPWQATARATVVPELTENPELAAASEFFWSKVAERYFEFMMSWLEASADEPAQWQQAAQFGDEFIYLTAAELTALGEQMHALIAPYLDRQLSPGLRPPGARLVGYLPIALPVVNRGRRQGWSAPGSDVR